MKLPTSIFPNITEYLRANWKGYLNQRTPTLSSYSIVAQAKACTSIEQLADGVIVINKKPSATFGKGDYNIAGTTLTIDNIPTNSRMLVGVELVDGAADYSNPWTKDTAWDGFTGNPSVRHLDVVEDVKLSKMYCVCSKTIVSGSLTLSLQYGMECSPRIYIVFYDCDRLDACLTGDHLKPIAVGDKLGLVYWDGYIAKGGNFIQMEMPGVVNTDSKFLNYYTAEGYNPILKKAGTTMMFSGKTVKSLTANNGKTWETDASATNDLLPHLFHVI